MATVGVRVQHRSTFTPKRSLVRSQYRPPQIFAGQEPVAGTAGNGLLPSCTLNWEQIGSTALPPLVGLAFPMALGGRSSACPGSDPSSANSTCDRLDRISRGPQQLEFHQLACSTFEFDGQASVDAGELAPAALLGVVPGVLAPSAGQNRDAV